MPDARTYHFRLPKSNARPIVLAQLHRENVRGPMEVLSRSQSYPLAKSESYVNPALRTSADENRPPELLHNYVDNAKPVAEQRISLASDRLSGGLAQPLSKR